MTSRLDRSIDDKRLTSTPANLEELRKTIAVDLDRATKRQRRLEKEAFENLEDIKHLQLTYKYLLKLIAN